MQRSPFTPAEPFVNVVPSDQLPNKMSNSVTCHQSTNTLVVNGGIISVGPFSNRNACDAKITRTVSTNISPVPKSHGASGSKSSNVCPDLSQMLEAMNNSNRALLCRSLCEVLQDLDDVLERLARARQVNDEKIETELDAASIVALTILKHWLF
jgi:hypothetical protein